MMVVIGRSRHPVASSNKQNASTSPILGLLDQFSVPKWERPASHLRCCDPASCDPASQLRCCDPASCDPASSLRCCDPASLLWCCDPASSSWCCDPIRFTHHLLCCDPLAFFYSISPSCYRVLHGASFPWFLWRRMTANGGPRPAMNKASEILNAKCQKDTCLMSI